MINFDHNEPTLGDVLIRVQTRFGEFEADPRNIVRFPAGLPGFEPCRHFVVLTSVRTAPLQCLHAVDGPPASFLAIDPRLVLPRYRCILGRSDRLRLGATAQSVLLWLALVTVDEQNEATVNLRAPVVINPAQMVGYQVLPLNSLYPLRHPLTFE